MFLQYFKGMGRQNFFARDPPTIIHLSRYLIELSVLGDELLARHLTVSDLFGLNLVRGRAARQAQSHQERGQRTCHLKLRFVRIVTSLPSTSLRKLIAKDNRCSSRAAQSALK